MPTIKKPAPGIPRTVLLEPYLYQELSHIGFELLARFLGAIRTHLNRLAVVKTEHSHEALGVDSGAVIAYHNAEGLDRGKLYKILNILERMQVNIKLLHRICLLRCTKAALSCIIENTRDKLR